MLVSLFSFSYTKKLQIIRHFTNNVRLLAKNHYDSLGITAAATQADVKSAYYKLSMQYHPDKNEGSADAATKFRQATEAYEVLGNVRLRRLYDRGMHNFPVSEPVKQQHYYRESKIRAPPPTGKTPIFDFDEWSRAHYGSTFAKDMAIKRYIWLKRRKAMQDAHDIQLERILFIMFALIGCLYYISYENYDENKLQRNSVPTKTSKDKT